MEPDERNRYHRKLESRVGKGSDRERKRESMQPFPTILTIYPPHHHDRKAQQAPSKQQRNRIPVRQS